MADIFDRIDKQKGDIFDQVEASPDIDTNGDIFDQIAAPAPVSERVSLGKDITRAIKETPEDIKIGTIALTANLLSSVKRRAVQLSGGGILPDDIVLNQFEAVEPEITEPTGGLLFQSETERLFKAPRLPGAVAAQAAGVVTRLPDVGSKLLRAKQEQLQSEQDQVTLATSPITRLHRAVVQGGVPSVGAAIAISLLTGSPLTGLAVLGETEGGAAFQEQLDQGGSVRKSLLFGELSEAAEIGGEMLVFPKILKGFKGGLSVRKGLTLVAENATQEGITSFNQRFLEVFGGETSQGMDKKEAAKLAFFEGVKAIPEGAFVGGATGAGAVTLGSVTNAIFGEEGPVATAAPQEELSILGEPVEPVAEEELKIVEPDKPAEAIEEAPAPKVEEAPEVAQVEEPQPDLPAIEEEETPAVKQKKNTERERVISRFKGKVTNRDSLETIGNQMADHLGIERPTFWRFQKSPKDFGIYGETRTFSSGEKGIVIDQGGKSLVIKNQAEVDYMWDNSGIKVKIGQKVFPSQGLIKHAILHELLHISQGSIEDLGIDVATVKDDIELQKLVHTEGFKKNVQETRKELFKQQPEKVPIEETKPEPEKPAQAVEAKPPTITEGPTDEDLVLERRKIQETPSKLRKPKDIERITEIEDELVERNISEFPDIDITEEQRATETKKVADQIKGHGIYLAEEEGVANLPDLQGTFQVDQNEMSDIKGLFEGRRDILRKFKVSKTGGRRWDDAAEQVGIDNFNDFVDMVEMWVETTKGAKGGINEIRLAKAANSNEPDFVILAMKHSMLAEGFTAAEVNQELRDFAQRENIALENLNPDLISIEGITDVEKKQRILKELDETFKTKAKKQILEPEQEAIVKARVRAAKEKRPMFVVERKGKFRVTVNEPKTGEFTKVTPAGAGETTGKTEQLEAKPKPKKEEKPKDSKEQRILRQRINIEVKKKGLTNKQFTDIKQKRGGSGRLTGKTPRTVEQLKEILKGVERARPKVIGHRKVLSLKSEKQIAELNENLTNLGFMNKSEFQKILNIETKGKQAKYTDSKNFITQKEANNVLARMHDTAQRLRVTEPIRRAVDKNPHVKREIAKIKNLPRKTKDPSRLRAMRTFFQRLGEQSKSPIYDIFLDLTFEEQRRSRDRHKSMKLAEALPDFVKMANKPESLQRIEDWIVSQSNLQNKPKEPSNITGNEIRLAKLIQASFKSYEKLARAGKFFEFFDNRTEMPQYLQFKQGIDKAFDIYNTKGYDALIEYLDTQDWGIVRAGYSPMESVVKKVSTNRMPDIAVGKKAIKVRGVAYRKQDRDILQRWYSYMRQMDQLIHIQPRIKSLVRLVNDNQEHFIKPEKVNSSVSTYLDNLKHTNYEDGLIEDWSRRFYSQAVSVIILADPVKPVRNLFQNLALAEDRRTIFDPRNKKLSGTDTEFLETHVQQSSVMMSDWAFVGEDPLFFKNLTKWIQRNTLYPQSDRTNRLISFFARINQVRRAFKGTKPISVKMRDAKFSDMQKAEQVKALEIFATEGVDQMARYVAKVKTDDTHFLYGKEQRSPAEQTTGGKILLNLFLFRKAALGKGLTQLSKVFEKGTPFRSKVRAGNVLVTLLAFSYLTGILYQRLTGKKYNPYSYTGFLEMNFGGLNLATLQRAEDVYNDMLEVLTAPNAKEMGKAVDNLNASATKAADFMIPFYDMGFRAIEATFETKNIDRWPGKKIREIIDKEYTSRGLANIERSLIEKIQFTFAKGGGTDKKEDETPQRRAKPRK